MTKVKKTILWSTVACLCVFAVAGTAIGVSYSMYSNSNSGSGLINIPSWGFDLTSGEDASFQTETSAKLAPDQSAYTEGNTNRSNLSNPIGVAKITNNGDVTGDLQINAGIKESDPYVKNSKYEANEQFENEFLSHFEVYTYYSSYLDSSYGDDFNSTLVRVDSNTYITLYPETESDNISTFNSVYIYVRVNWISDIDNNNGDAFDTWVGKYISKINLSVGFSATQHGGFIPTSETAKLGAKINSYTCYYFDGTIDSGHLGVTTNYQEAVDLTITEFEEGKYTLGFYSVEPTKYYDDSGLTYIGYSGSGTSLTLTSDPYTWYYDDSYDVFYTYDNNDSQRFIGNQDGCDYFACYSYNNITNNSYHTGSSFESEPELEEAPEAPNEPQVGDPTYKLGAICDNGVYRYFTSISSSHLQTTTEYSEATDVYITALDDGVDNSCTLAYFEDETIQYIACSESGTNMKKDTSPYTWVYNDEEGYFYTPSFNDRLIANQTGYDYFGAYLSTNSSQIYYVFPFDTNPDEVIPESITISGFTDEVLEGSSLELSVSVLPITANQNVTWSSSNDSVASVDQAGTVYGVSEGKAIIKATSVLSDSIYDEYKVSVTSLSSHDFVDSETIILSEISHGNSGNIQTVTLNGEQVKITVDQNKDGGGNSSSAPNWSADNFRLYYGQTITFEPLYEGYDITSVVMTTDGTNGSADATLTDTNGIVAGTITRDSSAKTVTLDVGVGGTIVYTNVRDSSNTQLHVTGFVIKYGTPNTTIPESINVTGDTDSIGIGETLQLQAVVLPDTANQLIVWSSSDEDVATVNQSGLVTGQAGGETTIRATSVLSDSIYGEYDIIVSSVDEEGRITDSITYKTIMALDKYEGHTWSGSQDVISSTTGEETIFKGCSVTWYTGSQSGASSNGCCIYNSSSLRFYRYAYFEISPLEGYEIESVTLNLSANNNYLTVSNATMVGTGSGVYEVSAPQDSALPITVLNDASSSNTITFADAGIVVVLIPIA